jgi:hypothetical protein
MVHFTAHRALGSPLNIYVKEGKVAVSLRLRGELNILLDIVQIVKEDAQLAGSLWPDNESAVHVTEPTEGLMGRPVEHQLLKILREKVGYDWR